MLITHQVQASGFIRQYRSSSPSARLFSSLLLHHSPSSISRETSAALKMQSKLEPSSGWPIFGSSNRSPGSQPLFVTTILHFLLLLCDLACNTGYLREWLLYLVPTLHRLEELLGRLKRVVSSWNKDLRQHARETWPFPYHGDIQDTNRLVKADGGLGV